MRNTNREIECLKRLQELSPVFEEMVAFLTQEYMLTPEEIKELKLKPEQARHFQAKLAALSAERKLQLLEYEWTILPVERIKVTMVTATGFKEFNAEV